MSALKRLARKPRALLLDRVLDRSGETSEAVRLGDLGITDADYHDYEPSGWRGLQRAIKGFEIGPEDGFLDIGCGKGRVVTQAARRPFGRVLGVELSTELAGSARRLVSAPDRRRRCHQVEIVVADVTAWEIPDDVTFVYVYNALSGAALGAMLDRIADSARQAPRRLLLFYANPVSEADVLGHRGFDLLERRGSKHWRPTDPRRISIFEVSS